MSTARGTDVVCSSAPISKSAVLEVKKMVNAKHRAVIGYRYISWILTSLIFLIESSEYAIKYRIAIVALLLAITLSINHFYFKSNSGKSMIGANIAETLIIAALIFQTGGLESPFIWYAVNPILIAAAFLKAVYCWADFFFYLAVASLTSMLLHNPDNLPFYWVIADNAYIILVFVLIVVAVHILFALIQQMDSQAETLKKQKEELQNMNLKLEQANARAKNSMEHIMSLYRIIEVFSAREYSRDILKHMVKLANDILQTRSAFIWIDPFQGERGSLVTGNFFDPHKDKLIDFFTVRFEEKEKGMVNPTRQVIVIDGSYYLIISLKSLSRFYGYFGTKLSDRNETDLYQELLKFMADIITMVMERNHYEKVSSQLMIIEEQNRIGNEIHDNVSQLLFKYIYGIHALSSNWPKLSGKISKRSWIFSNSLPRTSQPSCAVPFTPQHPQTREKVYKPIFKTISTIFRAERHQGCI